MANAKKLSDDWTEALRLTAYCRIEEPPITDGPGAIVFKLVDPTGQHFMLRVQSGDRVEFQNDTIKVTKGLNIVAFVQGDDVDPE